MTKYGLLLIKLPNRDDGNASVRFLYHLQQISEDRNNLYQIGEIMVRQEDVYDFFILEAVEPWSRTVVTMGNGNEAWIEVGRLLSHEQLQEAIKEFEDQIKPKGEYNIASAYNFSDAKPEEVVTGRGLLPVDEKFAPVLQRMILRFCSIPIGLGVFSEAMISLTLGKVYHYDGQTPTSIGIKGLIGVSHYPSERTRGMPHAEEIGVFAVLGNGELLAISNETYVLIADRMMALEFDETFDDTLVLKMEKGMAGDMTRSYELVKGEKLDKE